MRVASADCNKAMHILDFRIRDTIKELLSVAFCGKISFFQDVVSFTVNDADIAAAPTKDASAHNSLQFLKDVANTPGSSLRRTFTSGTHLSVLLPHRTLS